MTHKKTAKLQLTKTQLNHLRNQLSQFGLNPNDWHLLPSNLLKETLHAAQNENSVISVNLESKEQSTLKSTSSPHLVGQVQFQRTRESGDLSNEMALWKSLEWVA